MANSNPFRPTRFEHQEHPLIWLSPNVRHLEGLKSLYLAGTRGSGKTSLLKAINWQERLNNRTLSDQIADTSIADYVAVYFRLPDYISGAISAVDWSTIYPNAPDLDYVEYDFFAKIIEVISAQLVCEAFSTLRSSAKLHYTIDQERELVSSFTSEHPNVFPERSDLHGLDDIARQLRFIQRRLNSAVVRGSIKDFVGITPETLPGVFINDLCARVKTLACGIHNDRCRADFHIKICIDDCETLRSHQQRFINTLVRNSKNPLFWVISYVSTEYDTSSTIINNQNLTDADRTQHDLNTEKEPDFRQLCEEVSSLRLYYSLLDSMSLPPYRELKEGFFRLDDVYGTKNLNRLILETTRGSLSISLSELFERAEKMREKFSQAGVEHIASSAPPIWQTYVVDRLGIQIDNHARRNKIKNLHAYLRRKQRAALLNICSQYKIKNIPYAGTSAVISMSDLCVRDYLEIAASILDVALERGELKSLSNLANRRTPLSLANQREGIVTSSRNKFEGIKNSLEQDWVEVMKVVECLGHLCARLQSEHRTTDALATPERGLFVFNLSSIKGSGEQELAQRRNSIMRILQRCEADGLLRPDATLQGAASSDVTGRIDEPANLSSTVTYRLHRRFAAFFGFSYRGPYALVQVPMDDFAMLCQQPQSVSTQDWVEKAFTRVGGLTEQTALF